MGRRALLIVVALVVCAAFPAAAQASLAGCGASGPFEVCFNDPTGPLADQSRIVARERELIQATRKGDSIRIAMFSWTIKTIARDLRAAHKREVDVAIVVDAGSYKRKAVRIMRDAGVPVTRCRRGCMSRGKAINHLKLFLIRRGASSDILVSSSNLTGKQRSELYNDLVRIHNDSRLFPYLSAYWNRLRARSWGNFDRTRTGSTGTRAYLFPRAKGDPVVQALRSIRSCRGRRGGGVLLSMAIFTKSRKGVQPQLRRLAQRKRRCPVRVVIGRKVDAGFVGAGLPRGAVRRAAVHHKFLVLAGRTKSGYRHAVYTGSHNYSRRALRANDEILLRLTNPGVVAAYAGHFGRLFRLARPTRG